MKKPADQGTVVMCLVTELLGQIARADRQRKTLPPRIRRTSRRLQAELTKLMVGRP